MGEPRLVGGRYELGEMLGLGGMAEVRAGRDRRLGRKVAIKILRADLVTSPMFAERFRREALAAAALDHPAIVAVYDAGEDEVDGAVLPYIVMEYVEGQTLRDLRYGPGRASDQAAGDEQHAAAAADDEARMAETGEAESVESAAVADENDEGEADGPHAEEITPARALEITAGVLAALEYSHRAGVVHRDIKPANVMLASSGAVKVMDFGIARVLDAAATMTGTSTVIGTAHYLSPEQARGDAVDGRSDVYSTGCLLYELLTYRPPFLGDSPVAVAYQHVRQEPHPPSAFVPDLPPAVEAITLKALAKNVEDRYSSAAAMAADIHRALAGQDVRGHPAVATTAKHASEGESGRTGTLSAVDATADGEREPGLRRRAAPVLAVLAMALVVGFGAFGLTGLLGSDDESGGEAEPRRSEVQDPPREREPIPEPEEGASPPGEDRAEPAGEVSEPTSNSDEGEPEPIPTEETPQEEESTPTEEEPTEDESPESTPPPSDPPDESETPEDSETPPESSDDPTEDETETDEPPTTDPEESGEDPPEESSGTPQVRADQL